MRDSRRTRLLLALLLLTAFALITLDYRAGGGGVFGSIRRTAASAFGPVERVAADVVRPVRGAVDAVTSVGSNHKKIKDLQQQVTQLRAKLRNEPFEAQRVAELDKLLHVSSVGQYTLVPAQVIAVGAGNGFEWTATIDAGSMDGIKTGMTVLNGDGLVGRTTIVGRSTSTVLLAIDPQFHVGVQLADGATGVVTGRQKQDMTLELIDPAARVKPGDGLVTRGSDNQSPFVWGVPVGSVRTATSPLAGDVQQGTVKPYVNFGALDLVGIVVQPPRTNPRDALLQPPVPTVTVTVTATPPASPPGSTASGSTASGSTASGSTTPRPTPVRPTPSGGPGG